MKQVFPVVVFELMMVLKWWFSICFSSLHN